MRLLFVHPNFPGQYRHLARHYASLPGNEVTGLGDKANLLKREAAVPGARLLGYELPDLDPQKLTPFDEGLHRAVQRGRIVATGAAELRRSGYRPDLVFTHLGWGEGLFLKDIFPEARILLYCEYFYRQHGGDFGFDPEFPASEEAKLALRLMNAPLLLALDASDWGVAPTYWQRDRFPEAYAERISVIHDGIDTDAVRPDPEARFRVPGSDLTLTAAEEVVTYAARNLEPHRGFHVFMRAIPEIQRRHPRARVVIAGGDGVSYSPPPPPGDTYRARLLRELGAALDPSRVHFTGRLPYADYLSLLRVSSAHVYLTYPFVLSWSLLEALAAGCLVVASRTPPVQEVIRDRDNGLLAGFFAADEIATCVSEALCRREEMQPIRERARSSVVARYDLKRVCLPAQLELGAQLCAGRRPGAGIGSGERRA